MTTQKLNRAFGSNIKKKFGQFLSMYELDIYDFETKFSDLEGDMIFTLEHRDYKDEIYFRAYSDDFQDAEFEIAPADRLNTDVINSSLHHCESAISDWVSNAAREITAIKEEEIEQTAQKIKKLISPHLEKCITDPDNYFSPSEHTILNERLDSLEEAFKEHREIFNLTQQSLEELTVVINEIKASSEIETQQRWYDRTLDKFGVWASRIDKVGKVVKAIEKGSNLLEKASNVVDSIPM